MNIYQDNFERYSNEISLLEKVTRRLSLWRGLSFILSLVVIIYLANERQLVSLTVFLPIGMAVFISILIRYNRKTNELKRARLLMEINEMELLKLKNDFSGFPTQETSLDKHHAYAGDLDIFGTHSLYQLLDRTTTESGSLRLAQWLLEPADKYLLIKRQEAIRELQPDLVWRQNLQAAGLAYSNKKSEYQRLLDWFATDEKLLPKKKKYFLAGAILALSATVFTVLWLMNSYEQGLNLYLVPMILVLLINHLILRRVAPIAEEIIDHTDRNVKTLEGYYSLADTILTRDHSAQKLQDLKALLNVNGIKATDEIKRLKKILDTFQLRGTKRSDSNKFYGFFNQFWLFDIYWIIQSESWKQRNRENIKNWIHAISEFEAINSLAGFAYSNPDYVFPEIMEEAYFLQFENIGHPLIASNKRICNDFDLSDKGQIAMITGSNMAGKSTFLRTLGVNIVLALMGGACCAKTAKVSQMKMFTSMRTKDNLEEGVSSFYAELQRVEQLLSLIENGKPIFFMLDELFKGTNSADRYKGGVSLIKQLSELNAFGIVSTHDLELARLAGSHMMVSNHSFNSQIQDGEMKFDYELKEGICTDFNATELMKRSGINVLKDAKDISNHY